MNQTQLETAAVQAYRARDTWATFWHRYGKQVMAAGPHNRQCFHRLLRRLTSLVASVDTDGMMAASDAPWEDDDAHAFPGGCSVSSALCPGDFVPTPTILLPKCGIAGSVHGRIAVCHRPSCVLGSYKATKLNEEIVPPTRKGPCSKGRAR